MDKKPTYMRASQTADAIGICKERLTQWASRGKITFHTATGRHRRFDVSNYFEKKTNAGSARKEQLQISKQINTTVQRPEKD